MLGALEHQVLEQVSEPGATGALVLRPDVIPNVDRDDRAAAIFVQQHVEPVRQRVRADRNVHRTTVRGMVGRVKMAIDTCAAVRSAAAMKARAAGDSGSLIIRGTPRSLPSRIGW